MNPPVLYTQTLTRGAPSLSIVFEETDSAVSVQKPRTYTATKRLLDIVFSVTGLTLTLPAALLIMVCIKLEDGGPIFFTQDRWGEGGRVMKVYKFRTMTIHRTEHGRSIQAGSNDERITRVGRFLRSMSLDEVPQILNILKGEMSFVGPRSLSINEIQANEPLETRHTPDYEIPGFQLRLSVRPGLTGIAQVCTPRTISRRHKFRYDNLYVRKRTLWLDMRLFVVSVGMALTRKWK